MQRVSKFSIVLVNAIMLAVLLLVVGAPSLRPKKIVERKIHEKLTSLSELSYSPEHTWTIAVQSKLTAKDIELLDPETGESLNNQLNVHRLAARFGAFGNIKQRDGFKILTLKKGAGFNSLWIRADGTVFGRNDSRSKKLKRLAQFDANYYENPSALKTIHKLAASIGVKDNQIIIRRKSDKRDKIIAAYREKDTWHGVLVNLVPETLKIMPAEAPAQEGSTNVEPELRVLPLEVEPTPQPEAIEPAITEQTPTETISPEISTEVSSESETTTTEIELVSETETTLSEPESSDSETATPAPTQTDPNATVTPSPESPSENLESEATTEITSESETTPSESETTSIELEAIPETETSTELLTETNELDNELAAEPEVEAPNQEFDVCGDTLCNGEETCNTCEQDCGRCASVCGDGICSTDEFQSGSCIIDCGEPPAYCGDETCDPGESCVTCIADCGHCPPECGDGECNGDETCDSCKVDCGECKPVCGNSKIEGEEQCDDGNSNAGDGCVDCKYENKCGDGTLDDDENCDDGNTTSGDGCSSECEVEECGDGTVQGSEACDDGNTDNGDGCDSSCQYEPTCGNGTTEEDEECDDGNTTDGDGCSASCENEECGDDHKTIAEECDDGNNDDNDGCSFDCKIEYCADGKVNNGEMCDDGNTTDGDGCNAHCETEVCGDGRVSPPGEECDDENNEDGDGCNAFCITEFCGDSIVNNQSSANTSAGEECDLGPDNSDTGLCRLDCRYRYCGDGIWQPQYEDCDPQAPDMQDCPADCELVICGDSNVEGDEECDDGNEDSGDGCSAECVIECGNGTLDTNEECDDGNTTPDDGCDASCLNECGNGTINGTEECDDGNTNNGDGCDEACKKEECEISIEDTFSLDGQEVKVPITVLKGGKIKEINATSIPSEVDWTNAAQSTSIDWKYDIDRALIKADKAYWYGYDSGETLCTHESVTEKKQGIYLVHAKVEFQNGCRASKIFEHEVINREFAGTEVQSRVTIDYLGYKYTSDSKTWNDNTKAWEVCGHFECTSGDCIKLETRLRLLYPRSGQYYELVEAEEYFHLDQLQGLVDWDTKGGLTKNANYAFDNQLIEKKYSFTNSICRESRVSVEMAETIAMDAALTNLRLAMNTWRIDAANWYFSKDRFCWSEYTAKKHIGWTEKEAAAHYDCAYVRTVGCPSEPTVPKFFWDNK